MTISVTKPSINLREKLNELDQPQGIKGTELLRADTVAEARTAIGAGRKNLIINGGFDVWQRGTTVSGTSTFLSDRWFNTTSATQSRQTFTVGQTDVPHNPTYYYRQVTGSSEWYETRQKIENVALTSGREVTLSYWMKGSSAFTNVPFRVQNFGSGGSSEVSAALTTASVTTSWAKYTQTFTLPSVSGKTIGAGSYLQIHILRANLNNITIDIANVQLEYGNAATDFEHRSYAEELALCQRYYVKWGDQGEPYYMLANGYVNASTQAQVAFRFNQEMRAAPTAGYSGTWQLINSSGNDDISVLQFNRMTKQQARIEPEGANFTVASGCAVRSKNDSDAYVYFDAEL